MKKSIILFSLLLLVLVACQKEEQVIVKKKTTPQSSKENPELIEQSNEDEVDEMIEFVLPDEKVMINLEMVPILNSYLKAAQDRGKVVESMQLTPIEYTTNSQLYLLEFSCVNDACSYLLLNKNEGNQAYLVADLAESKEIKMSSDHSKILLQFNRNDSMPMQLSDITVIDITNWELLQFENSTNEITVFDYRWPVLSADWIDNKNILLTIPAIDEPSSSLLSEWKKTSRPTQEIKLTLDN